MINLALKIDPVLFDRGVTIAAVGLLIVFAALLLITAFIAGLPRITAAISQIYPEVPDRHAPQDASESLLPDEAVLAAVGFVLHTELQKQVGSGGAD